VKAIALSMLSAASSIAARRIGTVVSARSGRSAQAAAQAGSSRPRASAKSLKGTRPACKTRPIMKAAASDLGACTTAPPMFPRRTVMRPFGLEDAEGLAQGRPAHLELLEELVLLGEEVPVGDVAVDDAGAQAGGNQVGDPRLAELRPDPVPCARRQCRFPSD
jgi:hypothetical protein